MQNCPHSVKYMGVKREVVALLICLHLLEQPEHCFRAGSQWAVGSVVQAPLHQELAYGEIGPQDDSLSEDLEGEQSLCEGWLLLHFQMSYLLIQPSPKSRDRQAKQTQLCKTNLVPKASTDPPSFPGKENHCCGCLPSLRAGGLGLLFSFLAFGVLCCNLYLNIGDREDACFVCLGFSFCFYDF